MRVGRTFFPHQKARRILGLSGQFRFVAGSIETRIVSQANKRLCYAYKPRDHNSLVID